MISIIFLDFVLDMRMIYIHHLRIIRNYRKRHVKRVENFLKMKKKEKGQCGHQRYRTFCKSRLVQYGKNCQKTLETLSCLLKSVLS